MSVVSKASRRLQREYRDMQRQPTEGIRAAPLEENILEWHYVLEGSKGSPYEGGWYHGKVTFPENYPMAPPKLCMLTPSGRFEPGKSICLSMTEFHPENWNPMWHVSTILLGLQSFMTDDANTYGSIQNTSIQRRAYAQASLSYNVRNETFKKLFPQLVTLHERMVMEGKIDRNTIKETNKISHDYSEWFIIATLVAMVGVMAVYFGDIASQLSGLISKYLI